jgi:hypothetical protein
MAKYARISKQSWNYMLKDMELNPDDRNIYETTEENGNYLCVSISVDWWYRLLGIEVEMWNKNGKQLEVDPEQLALLEAELESELYELTENAKAEARAEAWDIDR